MSSKVYIRIAFQSINDYNNKDNGLVLKLLQVRPVGEYGSDSKISVEAGMSSMEKVLVKSSKALGSGHLENITHVIHVPSGTFDSAKTKEMAQEIACFNSVVRNEGGSYLLVGPGRWGSSDPWLGIPVLWSDISEAKVIVESAIPGYQIEPSQGTHFFQNMTSFGAGYVNVNSFARSEDSFDVSKLDQMPAEYESEFIRMVHFEQELSICVDGRAGKAVVASK